MNITFQNEADYFASDDWFPNKPSILNDHYKIISL